MLRMLKETVDKVLKEIKRTMCEQVGNINRGIEMIKSTIAKIKIGWNIQWQNCAGRRRSQKPENRAIEITLSEDQKEKIKKNEE